MKAMEVLKRYLLFLALPAGLVVVQACNKDKEEEDPDSRLGTIIDYDGNKYRTIELGDQWWMVTNLKVTHYADGTEIPLVEHATVWEALGYADKAYCFYNNSTLNEERIYGGLYTWAAVMNGAESSHANPSGVQGVCPDGWHVPSDSEWKELEMFLGMTGAAADSVGLRGNNEGSKLATSAALWQDGYLEWNHAFGTSGFNAQPGGGRRYDGSFDHKGHNANFWSSSQYNYAEAWSRHIYSNYSSAHRYHSYKSNGFSVRCVKDD